VIRFPLFWDVSPHHQLISARSIYKVRNVEEEKSFMNCPMTCRHFPEERDWNCRSGKAYTSASYVISNLVSVYTNLYWNKNETKMYIVHSKATCCNSSWIKWHQAGSIYSTSKMMHGPINIRFCHSIYECLAQSVEAKANVILCNSYTISLFQILTISQFSITFPIPLDCTTIHAVKIGLLNKKLKSVNLDRYWDVGCRMRAVLAS